MATFQVGDEVEWSSQAQGSTTTKRGRIVLIVQGGQRAGDVIGPFRASHATTAIDERSMDREGESYFVEVGGDGPRGGKPKLYWPLASKLRAVETA